VHSFGDLLRQSSMLLIPGVEHCFDRLARVHLYVAGSGCAAHFCWSGLIEAFDQQGEGLGVHLESVLSVCFCHGGEVRGASSGKQWAMSWKYCSKPAGGMISRTFAGSSPVFQKVCHWFRGFRTSSHQGLHKTPLHLGGIRCALADDCEFVLATVHVALLADRIIGA
jgi:hypothetical protein